MAIGLRSLRREVEDRVYPTLMLVESRLKMTGDEYKLSWPATMGVSYDILATTNPAGAFQLVTSLVASNTVIQWPIPVPADTATFFRVRLSP